MSRFCHNCGKKLEINDGFCQFCGTKVSVEPNGPEYPQQHQDLQQVGLEKKAWFRALKVVYLTLIVLAALFIGAVSWSGIPQKTIDGNLSSIACYNGKFYALNRNDIYPYGSGSDLDYTDDKHARILCKYDTLSFYSHPEFIDKNYTFHPIYTDVKYGSWIGYTILAFFILWLLASLLKMGFFYIALGEKLKVNNS